MKHRLPSFAIFAIMLFGCMPEKADRTALLKYDTQIDTIIAQMSLEEKAGMMHGKLNFVSSGVERLGIADMKYVDGPFGIREELIPHGWRPLGWETDSATFFPTGSALAATWCPELAYKYGTAMAREARLRGKDVLLGPAINIQRIPTGGRTYEYLSEDPFLSARLSVGYTKGVQDNGVAVCLKHYALNNQEYNRGEVNVVVGERAMREIYLPPFQAAVEEADAYAVMSAYNKVNGWWCAENDMLLNRILRKDWGFAGMVISDWGGTHSTVNAIVNGLNVEMPGGDLLGQAMVDSVNAGAVSEELVNQRVREILRVRLAIESIPEALANKEITSKPEQQKIAYDVAAKSIVMLKNEGILPIDLNRKLHIAVIGDNANKTMAKGGVGAGVKTLYEITPLEGLKARIGERAQLSLAQGYTPGGFETDKLHATALLEEALGLAGKADLVIFIGGNNREIETEGSDRKDMMFSWDQENLIKRIAEINPNIITVLVTGAPNDLNVVNPLSKALVISWFNGSEGGNALADVLIGNISPGGRLPFTFPLKLEHSPAYMLGNYNQQSGDKDIFVNLVEKGKDDKPESAKAGDVAGLDPNTAYYTEESLVGYRWYDTKNQKVMYPFGHGLTYTSFEYSSIKTNKEKYGVKDVISLTVKLENSGSYEAEEVVQAYVHRINSLIEWPHKELKAFSRVRLTPGQSKDVTLEIPVRELFYWNEAIQEWDYDPCDIELLVGASAGDIKLRKKISLKSK
jgi:beta-glucosidase